MIYHVFITTKAILFFFSFLQRYNLLCSNTTLLKGLSIEHITTIKNKLNFKRDESHRSYRRYSAERKPEIQAYIVKLHSRPLRYRYTALPVKLASPQLGADFHIPISVKTLGKMQKYSMRRD